MVATGQALLDLVHPQHAGRHLLGHLQRLAQVALGLAEVLVVQAGKVQAQQRQAPQPGHRLGRQALAAALHTDQQHAARQVAGVHGEERLAALVEPALEIGQAADLGKARRLVLEAEHAIHVEQLEARAIEFRQVVLGDRAVVADHVARQQTRLGVGQAAQVLHHLLQGAVVGAHPHAVVALAPALRLLADDGQQLVLAGQRQAEARGQALQLGRQLERMGHQHQGRPLVARRHRHLLEQAHQTRAVGQERMQVAEHVEIGLRVGLDQAQRHLRLATVALAQRLATETQALHALGHRPQVQPQAAADRQRAEGFQHPLLVPGLDDDQAHARIEHQAQVMNIVLHTDSLLCGSLWGWATAGGAATLERPASATLEIRLWTACSARSSTAPYRRASSTRTTRWSPSTTSARRRRCIFS
ncbi:hypothetical protein D3C80_942480 [compost metagenome]